MYVCIVKIKIKNVFLSNIRTKYVRTRKRTSSYHIFYAHISYDIIRKISLSMILYRIISYLFYHYHTNFVLSKISFRKASLIYKLLQEHLLRRKYIYIYIYIYIYPSLDFLKRSFCKKYSKSW